MIESNALNMVVQSSAGLMNVLSQSRDFLEEILGDSDDFVAIVNREMRVLWSSYRMRTLFPEGIVNQCLYDVLEKQARHVIRRKIGGIRQVNQSINFELKIFEKDCAVPCLWSLRYIEILHQGPIAHEIYCLSGADISLLSVLKREANLRQEYTKLMAYSSSASDSTTPEDLVSRTVDLLLNTRLKSDAQIQVFLLIENRRISKGPNFSDEILSEDLSAQESHLLPEVHHSKPLVFDGDKAYYGIFSADKHLTGALELSIDPSVQQNNEETRFFGAILHTFAASLAKLRYKTQLESITEYRSTKLAVGFLQRRMFGKSVTTGVEVKPFYLPSDRCGGDWYSVYSSLPGQSTVYLADVTGHGMGAALVAGFMNGVVKSCHKAAIQAYGDLDPGERLDKVLREVSAIVFDHYETRFMASMVVMELIPEKGEIVMVNAGHVPPLLYKKETDSVVPLLGASSLIGFSRTAEFKVVKQKLNKDDRLLVFSDGVIEHETTNFGRLDRRQLRKHFREYGRKNMNWAEFTDKVKNYMPYHLNDDVTMVTINFTNNPN